LDFGGKIVVGGAINEGRDGFFQDGGDIRDRFLLEDETGWDFTQNVSAVVESDFDDDALHDGFLAQGGGEERSEWFFNWFVRYFFNVGHFCIHAYES